MAPKLDQSWNAFAEKVVKLSSQIRTSRKPLNNTKAAAFEMLISLTVGKVDAGVAVLLTPDKRLVSQFEKSQRGHLNI